MKDLLSNPTDGNAVEKNVAKQLRYDFKGYTRWCTNEIELNRAFSEQHKNVLRFNLTNSTWYYYDGTKWVADTGCTATRQYVEQFILKFIKYAEYPNRDSALAKFARKYYKVNNRDSLIRDAEKNSTFVSEDLNTDTKQFNCQNGTFDFRTLSLRYHNPDDMISKISNVIYNPDAKSEEFERFIDEITLGNAGLKDFLQKILGYSLLGDTEWDKCFILYGATTRNGKTTLLETIRYLMGGSNGYAMSTNPETFAETKRNSSQPSEHIARLQGCRFLITSEIPQNMFLNGALLKQLTGKDTITARFLYGSTYEFTPQFKLFFCTNYLPIVTDSSVFDSDRMLVIPFNRHFKPEEQDRGLPERLRSPENISGIFNWLVEGYKKYLKEGLTIPAVVREATDDFRKKVEGIGRASDGTKKQNAYIDRFLTERLEICDGCNILAKDVYKEYCKWCRENGGLDMGKSLFFNELRDRNLLSDTGTIAGLTKNNVVKGYRFKSTE